MFDKALEAAVSVHGWLLSRSVIEYPLHCTMTCHSVCASELFQMGALLCGGTTGLMKAVERGDVDEFKLELREASRLNDAREVRPFFVFLIA